MIYIRIDMYSILFLCTFLQNSTKIQSKYQNLNMKKQKKHVFKYICTSRILASFRKQTQEFHYPESLQGYLMLCGNIFNYISSRLLLIASSNSTSSVDLNSSSIGVLFTPRLSSLSHSLVVSDMLFNMAHIISPSKW